MEAHSPRPNPTQRRDGPDGGDSPHFRMPRMAGLVLQILARFSARCTRSRARRVLARAGHQQPNRRLFFAIIEPDPLGILSGWQRGVASPRRQLRAENIWSFCRRLLKSTQLDDQDRRSAIEAIRRTSYFNPLTTYAWESD